MVEDDCRQGLRLTETAGKVSGERLLDVGDVSTVVQLGLDREKEITCWVWPLVASNRMESKFWSWSTSELELRVFGDDVVRAKSC